MTNKEKRMSWPNNNNNSCFTWINIHLSKCELESRNIWSTDDKEKDFHLQSFDYRLNYNFLRLSYNLSTTYWATDFFSQETFIFRWSIVVERIEMYGSDNLSYINELCKKKSTREMRADLEFEDVLFCQVGNETADYIDLFWII